MATSNYAQTSSTNSLNAQTSAMMTYSWNASDELKTQVDELTFQVQCLIRQTKKLKKKLKKALKDGASNNN